MVGDRVPIVRAVHGEAVMAALFVNGRGQEGGDTPARGWPGADHVVLHSDGLATGIETHLYLLIGKRAGEIHRHVVFARIDQLDWLSNSLGRSHRRDNHVGLKPAPETTPEIMLVN